MGAAGSVGVDPTTLRKEYEAMVASNVSDEQLLCHMKKLILSSPPGDAGVKDKTAPNVQVADGTVRRKSVSRPDSHNSRLSFSSSKKELPRRGSTVKAESEDDDRPSSAPPEPFQTPKVRPRSSQGEIKGNNASKSRRRSYLGQSMIPGGINNTGGATGGPGPSDESEISAQVDSWESVSQQPSCPLCNMVFSTEGKREQHLKFSPMHTKKPEELKATAEEEEMMKLKTGGSRTIYSGTKLFWRSRLNLELFMQQHTHARIVQVLAFDTRTDLELNQLWIPLEKLEARISKEALQGEMAAAEKSFLNLGLMPTSGEVEAEASRKAAASFIIKRIQVEDVTGDDVPAETPKQYEVALQQMATDEGMGIWDLVVDQPAGVNPFFSRTAMKRASIEQVGQVMTKFRQDLTDIQGAAQMAANSLAGAEGAVEQGRRGSMEVARRASASGMVTGTS